MIFNMPQDLEALQQRLAHPAAFLRRVFELVCTRTVRILQEHSPGENLPNEWRIDVNANDTNATARIFHERLEGDRDTWEIVFHAHNSGTRRYMIYPNQAQALSWVAGGTRFFSKGHEVGGIQARHFAERADRVVSNFEQQLQGMWTRWIETGILPT